MRIGWDIGIQFPGGVPGADFNFADLTALTEPFALSSEVTRGTFDGDGVKSIYTFTHPLITLSSIIKPVYHGDPVTVPANPANRRIAAEPTGAGAFSIYFSAPLGAGIKCSFCIMQF